MEEWLDDKESIGSAQSPLTVGLCLNPRCRQAMCPGCEDNSSKEPVDMFTGNSLWRWNERDLAQRCKKSLEKMATMNFPVQNQPKTMSGKKTQQSKEQDSSTNK